MSSSFGTQFILSPKRPLVASLLWVCKPLFFLSHLRRFFYILPHISGLHPCLCYSVPTGLYLTGDSLCLFLNKIQYLAKIVIFFGIMGIFGCFFVFSLRDVFCLSQMTQIFTRCARSMVNSQQTTVIYFSHRFYLVSS